MITEQELRIELGRQIIERRHNLGGLVHTTPEFDKNGTAPGHMEISFPKSRRVSAKKRKE